MNNNENDFMKTGLLFVIDDLNINNSTKNKKNKKKIKKIKKKNSYSYLLQLMKE